MGAWVLPAESVAGVSSQRPRCLRIFFMTSCFSMKAMMCISALHRGQTRRVHFVFLLDKPRPVLPVPFYRNGVLVTRNVSHFIGDDLGVLSSQTRCGGRNFHSNSFLRKEHPARDHHSDGEESHDAVF